MEAATSPRKSTKAKTSLHVNGVELRNVLPRMTESAFLSFCQEHPTLKIEQDKHGNILIMPPVSYESGHREAEIIVDLGMWNRKHKLGKTFSSQTMFILPDGEKRLPDAAWISNEKDATLTAAERQAFARIVPDFVAEMQSPSDSPAAMRQKMRDVWIANGVRLAWLIDPQAKKAHVFRADGTETLVSGFDQALSGEAVLPDFTFDLSVLTSQV
jgi:Uma2 family endonuclease